MFKYNGTKKPMCKGWWWCVPSQRCEWHKKYADGRVVKVYEADDYRDREDEVGLGLRIGIRGNSAGFTSEHSGDVFGKWYGPIPEPQEAIGSLVNANPRQLQRKWRMARENRQTLLFPLSLPVNSL